MGATPVLWSTRPRSGTGLGSAVVSGDGGIIIAREFTHGRQGAMAGATMTASAPRGGRRRDRHRPIGAAAAAAGTA